MWNVLLWPDKVLACAAIKFIKLYQSTFSPDHSALGKGDPLRGCKYYPSCSNYGIVALQKYGFISSLPRILWRVLRCNPWSHGGVDHP